MHKDIFSFAEHHEKDTYGLGYKLTKTRNKVETILDKAVGIADARLKIDHRHWCVPHYTPFIPEQVILFKQFWRKTPTERRYIDWFVFLWKKWIIETNGISNWVEKRVWIFLYGYL